nr:immunoglobulin heavy chain junction region [Mus musculus]
CARGRAQALFDYW